MAQTSSKLKLSLVVPVYNGQETIEECLHALCRQTVGMDQYEVLVIDDGSTDATPEIIARFPVRCVRLPANRGRIVARLTGAREAACDELLFCDSRVICESDVVEKVLAHPYRPLMFGSDFPEEYQTTLYGLFTFSVYRKLWKPVFPQEWYGPEAPITPENFDRMPKGTGVLAVSREFFLRHQPTHVDKFVSDDTLLLSSMVKEKPIVRYCGMKTHYRQRRELKHVLPHLHFRGILFDSYYLRPGHWFLWLYLALWAVAAGVVVAAALTHHLWIIPAALAAIWIAASAALAINLRTFLAILTLLPLIGCCFATGILRGHLVSLRRWMKWKSE